MSQTQLPTVTQQISADVKLGRGVRIFGFTNLYGCEIGDDKTDAVLRRTARAAVGDVGDTARLINNHIIEEARLAICHAIQWNAFDRAAGIQIQHHQFLRTHGGFRFSRDEPHIQGPQPAILTVNIEAKHVTQVLVGSGFHRITLAGRKCREARRSGLHGRIKNT